MNDFEKLIQSILRDILFKRTDVTLLACKQLAKFEGWVKSELATAVSKNGR